MLRTDLLAEPVVWSLMRERFPWVEEERGDIGEGLVHLEFAALRRGVERAADSADCAGAISILSFVEELLADSKRLHPDVINAIEVSFVEDLFLGEVPQAAFIEPLLPPLVRVVWTTIADAHEKRSG
jgi:hypothetical protein